MRNMSERRSLDFVGAEGNRLAGDLLGPDNGPVALLLHGGGQTRYSWGGAARRLAAAGWRAITVDQRGHGESAWVESGHYAFFDYAADCACVAEQIAMRFDAQPTVVGASMGGIASILAQGESERALFDALILVDITPTMDPAGVATIQGFMRAHMQEGFASIDQAAEAVAAYLPHRRRPSNTDGLRKNLRLDADGRYRWHWDPRFLDGPRPINTGRGTGEERLIDAAANLRLPTLLVRGGQSELVSEEHARAFLDLVPHARYADVSGAGHMVAGDKNDIFASAVLEFLNRLQEDRSALLIPISEIS